MIVLERTCTRCASALPPGEFYPDKYRKDGLNCWCKSCVSETNRENYQRSHERIRARQSEYVTPLYLRERNLKKYGLNVASYEELLAAQGGHCAICGRLDDGDPRRLHVDHDHETGKVRGLLCGACNRGIGQFLDDSERVRKAADYLAGHGR